MKNKVLIYINISRLKWSCNIFDQMIEENEDRLSEEDVIGILEITKNMGKQADNSASY